MQKRPIKILIACGSGIATSTLAAQSVREICEERGIEAAIQKSNMSEVVSKASQVDVVLTTNMYREELPVPLMSVTALITGIGEEAAKKKCGDLLEEVAAKL
ncbi:MULTISPECIES: PTS sugar transporter subunit IIB [Mediterraneibacter]|uniref:PTS sugar transporter subunit IIB n=1 Tax=Mediterraneibacter TaxID=2316020 RepID=UPI0024AD87A8|nr:PTS sugar transporter subunit IIB [Mediterraneibacter massiliensis]